MKEKDNQTLANHICIYCKKSSNEVTFNSRDHIIPKGLGGKRRLDKGYVCDTCNNNLLSTLEQFMLRDSILSIPRMFLGPGSEGKTPKTRNDIGKIVLIKANDQNDYNLGVMLFEKPILIDQLLVNLDEKLLNEKENTIPIKVFSSPEANEGRESQLMQLFLHEMKTYEGKEIKLFFNELPTNDYIFGMHKGKFIIACNPDSNLDLIRKFIYKLNENNYKTFDVSFPKLDETFPNITATALFDDKLDRALIKVCMNVIALEKGKDEILKPKFNNLRDFVLTGKKNNIQSTLQDTPKTQTISSYLFQFPNDSHQVYIVNVRNSLWGFISFYGEYFQHVLNLSPENDDDYDLPIGFFCDWRNGKEILLSEFYNTIGQNAF